MPYIGIGNTIIRCGGGGTTAAKIFKMTSTPFARSAANTYNMTKAGTGTLTHTAKVGFLSNGTTTYLNTNYIPTNGVKYKVNDCCFLFKIGGTLKATGYAGEGGQNIAGTTLAGIFNNYTTAVGTGYLNSANSNGVELNRIGYNCVSRNAAGTFKQYINTDSYNLTGNSNILTTVSLFLLCFNEGGTASYFEANTAILETYGVGKSLTQAEFLTLQGILNAYIATL